MKCPHCGEDRLIHAQFETGRPAWCCRSCGRLTPQGPLRHSTGQDAGAMPSSSGDWFSTLSGPFQWGQRAAQTLQQQASEAAQQTYQDQLQRASDLLKQQQAQASGAAQQAGSQAQSAGLAIAVTIGALALVLYLTRT